VDYAARAQALAAQEPLDALLASWRDGRIKQRVLAAILADRAEAPTLYAEGGYEPLVASGAAGSHIVGFMRRQGTDTLVVAVPRLLGGTVDKEKMPIGPELWGDTTLPLPAAKWRDVVTGAAVETGSSPHRVAELFSTLPILVLRTMR
jgi:(1->4)-alpha-D-glucan 1-alpha-D-glucosylmutase